MRRYFEKTDRWESRIQKIMSDTAFIEALGEESIAWISKCGMRILIHPRVGRLFEEASHHPDRVMKMMNSINSSQYFGVTCFLSTLFRS